MEYIVNAPVTAVSAGSVYAAVTVESPELAPAFANVVPALFGAMAWKYYRKDVRLALVPFCCMSLLFMLLPSLTSSTSFMIIPAGALAIGLSWWKYRRNRKGAERA